MAHVAGPGGVAGTARSNGRNSGEPYGISKVESSIWTFLLSSQTLEAALPDARRLPASALRRCWLRRYHNRARWADFGALGASPTWIRRASACHKVRAPRLIKPIEPRGAVRNPGTCLETSHRGDGSTYPMRGLGLDHLAAPETCPGTRLLVTTTVRYMLAVPCRSAIPCPRTRNAPSLARGRAPRCMAAVDGTRSTRTPPAVTGGRDGRRRRCARGGASGPHELRRADGRSALTPGSMVGARPSTTHQTCREPQMRIAPKIALRGGGGGWRRLSACGCADGSHELWPTRGSGQRVVR